MIESTPENLEVNEAEHWMSEISIVQMGIIYIYICILTAVYLKKICSGVELLPQAGRASASSAFPPCSSRSSSVVNKCGAVSQTADSSRRRPA